VAHLKLMIARLRHDRFGALDASDPTSAVFAGWNDVRRIGGAV
jgi:hypothetical protein